MIANLQPYPEYKESGLPWFGLVPTHWSFRRNVASSHSATRPVFPICLSWKYPSDRE